jgi:phosphohistidine phosphatase
MTLWLIRHAIAADRDEFAKTGMDDELRPLTVEGRRKMRRVARGLRRVIGQLDLIASSPLVRAIETSHVISREFDKAHVAELKDLKPGGNAAGVFRLLAQQAKKTVALVGHEPDLGRLICLALGAKLDERIPLKKGGAAMVSFDGPVAPGAGVLRLMLSPQVLRKLARK